MSLQLEAAFKAQAIEALDFACNPNHIAPDTYGFCCGLRAHRRLGPRLPFVLSLAGAHGQRLGHQAHLVMHN